MSQLNECHECGNQVPYIDLGDLGRCPSCQEKEDLADGVRYIMSKLEIALLAARRGNRANLKAALRDARHEIEDLEKFLG